MTLRCHTDVRWKHSSEASQQTWSFHEFIVIWGIWDPFSTFWIFSHDEAELIKEVFFSQVAVTFIKLFSLKQQDTTSFRILTASRNISQKQSNLVDWYLSASPQCLHFLWHMENDGGSSFLGMEDQKGQVPSRSLLWNHGSKQKNHRLEAPQCQSHGFLTVRPYCSDVQFILLFPISIWHIATVQLLMLFWTLLCKQRWSKTRVYLTGPPELLQHCGFG